MVTFLPSARLAARKVPLDPFLAAAARLRPDPNRWSPPFEPDKPPVPYRTGFRFSARRVDPPPPFLGQYHRVPTAAFNDFIENTRSPSRAELREMKLVDYCSSVALHPLPCQDRGETAALQVTGELTVGDGCKRGHGPQVVTCSREGHAEPLVAKIYDPLYYPFADHDFPYVPNNVVVRAEQGFALESAAYSHLDDTFGGNLIPKFHGPWIVNVPLKDLERPFGLVLMEHIDGVPLSELDPRLSTKEERLRVMARALEAMVKFKFAGVLHDDLAPPNMICSNTNLSADDLRVRIVDFDFVSILPILGIDPPCKSQALPVSPLKRFWQDRPYEMQNWVPDGWRIRDWNQWLRDTWAGSSEFMPVREDELKDYDWEGLP